MKKKKTKIYSGIGGQAVLEGVMMRNGDKYAVAVRKPDNTIEVETNHYKGSEFGGKLRKIPFVRGIFVFVDSLVLGSRALNFSASLYGEDEEEQPGKAEKFIDKITGGHAEKFVEVVTMVVSFAIAIAIFMVLPYFFADLLAVYVRNESLLSLFEGIIRILIFIAYILLISRMDDIKRLFMYHGAEHKCINCIEHGHVLTTRNVKRSSRFHKRCGSSFILFVMLVSIVLFFFIRVNSIPLRLVIRLLLIPVISGISYELIYLAGRSEFILLRIISTPGLWMQGLTTKEPDESMIEVGIKSVEEVFDWKNYLKENFGYDDEYIEHEIKRDMGEDDLVDDDDLDNVSFDTNKDSEEASASEAKDDATADVIEDTPANE